MDYSYSPISHSQFRLFKGWLGEDGRIFGQIENFSIVADSADRSLPNYQTVSYAWGHGRSTNYANIDGFELPLLDNVHAFLLQMFSEQQGGWWWIDSICINQADEKEKSLQVAFMEMIFATAVGTRVWLGTESENSVLAFNFLHWMSTAPYSPTFAGSVKEELAVIGRSFAQEWLATNKLLKRPWWTRVWTVQEFTLSQQVELHCGTRSISRDDLQFALSAIYDCGMYLDTTAQWNRARIFDHYFVSSTEEGLYYGLPLVATLAYLGDHQATDPRDRVYSLAGIVKDFDLVGSPDYEEQVELLYTRIVKSFISKYHSLDIICLATVFDGSTTGYEKNLPTWVPDWRTQVTPLVVPTMVSQSIEKAGDAIGNLRPAIALPSDAIYQAAGVSLPNASFSSDMKEACIHGFVLGRTGSLCGMALNIWVNTVSTAYDPVCPHSETIDTSRVRSEGQEPSSSTDPAFAMKAIMRCLTLNRGDHYLSDYPTDTEFLREFTTLLILADGAHSDRLDFTAFRDWYRINRNFRACGWTLETLREQIEDYADEEHLPDKNSRVSFYSRFHDTTVKMSRRVVSLEDGRLGTAPRRAQKGDVVCILFGCRVPIVLRQVAGSDLFSFVGECYVDGFMEGEAMDTPAAQTHRMFKII